MYYQGNDYGDPTVTFHQGYLLIPVRPVDVWNSNSKPSTGRPELLDCSAQSESGQPVILPQIKIEENNWSTIFGPQPREQSRLVDATLLAMEIDRP